MAAPVRQLDICVSAGPTPATAWAIKAGLVDELQLYVVPVLVGGGRRALPDGVRSDPELLDTQRFVTGVVYLRYRTRSA